jgi:hypothetical protein
VKDKRTTDNVLVIKITVDIFKSSKRRIYWCFVDLEKAFDSIDREALWFKMRRKGVSDNIAKCIKKMYNGTIFCVKCGGDEVIDFVEQRRDVRQGCSLSPCLFNMFIDRVVYINRSRGSSGNIVSDYGLNDRGSIPDGGRGFFF